jgi:endonuclease-3
MTKKRAERVYNTLKIAYPEAHCELFHKNPIELLIATILSAQCTDKRVNEVTACLFKKYKKPEDYINASLSDIEEDIRSTGFFRNKAKNIQEAVRIILEKYNGQVPSDMTNLLELPGVGRKTANVILGNAFGIPGVVVDTHVSRVSQRVGFSSCKDPAKIEKDLCLLIKEKEWTLLSHIFISHGRTICKARKPLCNTCCIKKDCNYYVSIFT